MVSSDAGNNLNLSKDEGAVPNKYLCILAKNNFLGRYVQSITGKDVCIEFEC